MSDLRGFRAYQTHNAMLLHFNKKSDYDFFKYRGKTNAKLENFRSDKMKRIRYSGLEKRVGLDNLELYFFSTLKDENKRFMKFVPQVWYKNYIRFKEEIDQFETTFKSDLNTIIDHMKDQDAYRKDLFNAEKRLHPLIYTWYDRGLISELTFVFFDLFIERFLKPEASSDPLHWKKVIDDYDLKKGFFKLYVFRSHDKDAMIRLFEQSIGQ
jgi:hypothetical protein